MDKSEKTLFSRIIDKELPCEFTFSDLVCVGFKDIHPVAPMHWLCVTREPIAQLSACIEKQYAVVVHALNTAKAQLSERSPDEGGRLVINNGVGAMQTVFHLHIHMLAGRAFAKMPKAEEGAWKQENGWSWQRVQNGFASDHVLLAMDEQQRVSGDGDVTWKLLQATNALADRLGFKSFRVLIDVPALAASKSKTVLHLVHGPELGWPPC